MDMDKELIKLQMDSYERGLRDSQIALSKTISELREKDFSAEVILKATENFLAKENMDEKT